MTTWFILCTVVPYVNVWFILRNVVPDMDMSLHKKWSFPLRISSVNATKSAVSCGFCHNYMLFFHKKRFFSTQCQCCLKFLWIELQMLLRCCLIQISIIILRHFLCLVYSCPCLYLCLFSLVPSFMSYICDLFFIFIFILITINRIISLI